MNSKVDIILPNYNSADYITDTISSIIKQTYKKWNLIIIDDCSNKKTLEKLKKYKNKKIKIFYLKKNKGAGYCRNFALKKCRSKFVAFIHSDDHWEKNKLKKQINLMNKYNYHFTYSHYNIYKEKIKKKKSVITPLKLSFNSFVKNTSIATSTMVIRRNIIGNIRFSRTKICEDYFFKCQILKKIGHAMCCPFFNDISYKR